MGEDSVTKVLAPAFLPVGPAPIISLHFLRILLELELEATCQPTLPLRGTELYLCGRNIVQ